MNLEEFFKSRIDYVIEKLLNYIELDEFLDHIVEKNDKSIKYAQLSYIIKSIFKETVNEHLVTSYAYNGALKQKLNQFTDHGLGASAGILFRYRKCNICNKFLDDEIK